MLSIHEIQDSYCKTDMRQILPGGFIGGDGECPVYPISFYQDSSEHLEISPDTVAIIQIFLAKNLLHIVLLRKDDGMMDSYHECSQYYNDRI